MIAGLTRSTRRTLLPLLPSGPDGVHTPPLHRTRLSIFKGLSESMAERGGFEPPVHLCGHTHDFQSCSFSRSDIPPLRSRGSSQGPEIENRRFDRKQAFGPWLRNPESGLLRPISGGERGIRTPVRAFGPQIDFESIPLRPLRYLSACLHSEAGGDVILFTLKNPLKISEHFDS